MARIRNLEEKGKAAKRKQTLVDCGWQIVEVEGETLLQLTTYGSDERQNIGSPSQTVQIDADIAAELVRVLRRAFPGI